MRITVFELMNLFKREIKTMVCTANSTITRPNSGLSLLYSINNNTVIPDFSTTEAALSTFSGQSISSHESLNVLTFSRRPIDRDTTTVECRCERACCREEGSSQTLYWAQGCSIASVIRRYAEYEVYVRVAIHWSPSLNRLRHCGGRGKSTGE